MPDLVLGGLYHHFKGNDYKVLHKAKDSETGEDMVVYMQLYPPYEIYVRPLKMFLEVIERAGYGKIPRFTLISNNSNHE